MPERPATRIVAALLGNGNIGLVDQPVPSVRPGSILVRTCASLISPGTELGGWHQLLAEASNPRKDFKPVPFGYSSTGVVVEVGAGVAQFSPGDRIACVGGGYAQHTDLAVVPHNLCVHLPDNVSFAQGTYAMLAATALQAIRRAQPLVGEYFSVLGMGLVGQLTAQFLRASGCYVIGWDAIARRNEIARDWGIDATACIKTQDPVSLTMDFTEGMGLDGSVFAFSGDGRNAYEQTMASLQKSPDGHRMGRIVIVGGAKVEVSWTAANIDVRIAARTGPGYHDETWEHGQDYPPVFMRWTTRTHLALCMKMIADGRLNVNALTTNTIPLKDVTAGVNRLLADPDQVLGVILTV